MFIGHPNKREALDLAADLEIDDDPVHMVIPVRDLSDRNVVLATFGTGQSMQAQAAGPTVRKLSEPHGEEPPPR